MEKTMQDKETTGKIKREIFATLWSETDKLHLEYVFELIEKLEQEAERRGYEKGWKDGLAELTKQSKLKDNK